MQKEPEASVGIRQLSVRLVETYQPFREHFSPEKYEQALQSGISWIRRVRRQTYPQRQRFHAELMALLLDEYSANPLYTHGLDQVDSSIREALAINSSKTRVPAIFRWE